MDKINNIVAEDGYVIGTMEHLMRLRALAESRTEMQGIAFNPDDYKWVLGVKVINSIENKSYYVMAEFPDRPRTLFGIVVDRDFHNPDNVQLWENITNKV